MRIVVMALYVLLSVSGVVCFKLGSAQALALEITKTDFAMKISWLSILGLAFYVVSFLMYMGLIAKNNLSYLVPVLTGAVYLLTLLSSVAVFKETIGMTQIVGSILILAGVIFMNIGQ